MQIAPTAEVGAAEDAADGSGTKAGLASDEVSRTMASTQLDDLVD
jgi:hypothetical protein